MRTIARPAYDTAADYAHIPCRLVLFDIANFPTVFSFVSISSQNYPTIGAQFNSRPLKESSTNFVLSANHCAIKQFMCVKAFI